MSAVAGVVRFDGAPVAASDAERMAATMRHRGPDADGAWSDGVAALAHRALHTTPESLHERLPLVRGPLALVADARVDDRDALASRLRRSLHELGLPAPGAPLTDADLLLAAYAEWGEDCPDHVLGDFSFAVWDGRRRRLFCAKDPFGTRPLYYAHRPGEWIAFASATRPLGEFVSGERDEVFLADRLLGYPGDPARTPLRGVQSLLGGHALSADHRGVRIWQHFTVRSDPGVGAGWSDEDYAAGFRERFEESVRARSRSAFPVGADLSGGLDSSSVTVVARDILREEGRGPLHTFSTVHDDIPELDEREYIQAVVDQGGVVSHVSQAAPLSPMAALDEIVPLVDDDLMLGAHFTMWANLKAGRAAGVRTVLSGYDGDTVVMHGRPRLRELADAGDWAAFGRETRALETRYSRASHRQPFEDVLASAAELFLHYGVGALDVAAEDTPPWAFLRQLRGAQREARANPRGIAKRVWKRAVTPGPVLRLARAWKRPGTGQLSERAVEMAQPFADLASVRERVGRAMSETDPFTFQSVAGDHRAGLERLSLGRTGGLFSLLAGACGIEVAHPFFDRRLVEYSLALPADQKLRDGWTRYVLRRAMDDVLPESVAWRVGKANFAPAFHHAWFSLDGDRARSLLDRPGDGAAIVDMGRLRRGFEENASGSLDEVGATVLGLTVLHWAGAAGEDVVGDEAADPTPPRPQND
ncbi:lasso peptide isopeptide bond-forming cyclase [Rubrivirga sp. S365]|uniref:lasso peptide isopeptide bond-forming cyclase n=1 Tax=Rubrivirga sp. S365 TaxID=3076080 RepID=UPI0028C56148|nr:lasso peptide isopeptide bond-forming cyclase [Rubrivirga sp. S365]MDT7856633.1 lasso peptide isopeptide bond-forming cyclase [Rubrivirga sp. S365]